MTRLDEKSAVNLAIKTFNNMRQHGFKIVPGSFKARRGRTSDTDSTYHQEIPDWVVTFSIKKTGHPVTVIRDDQVIKHEKLNMKIIRTGSIIIRPFFRESSRYLAYEILNPSGKVEILVHVEYDWIDETCVLPENPSVPYYMIIENEPWRNNPKLWVLVGEERTKKNAERVLRLRKAYHLRIHHDENRNTRIIQTGKELERFINKGNIIWGDE